MPVAKLTASGTPNFMKTEDGNDSLDTIIRQAIGKEPFLSFPRAELPGWPLLSPVKVQLQKCDKCSREFCSPINYRRHIRVHHRLKKLDKDSKKNRDLLGAYWDKLSVEEAKEIVSFKDVMLEEVPGSSILKALTNLRKQGFSPLPQYYLRAGSALLDIVQSRPSSFPISSQELFSILDDSSEKTFLCGTAVSMQRYIFDGEAGKIGLEPKNLVACTSFLLEQKLEKDVPVEPKFMAYPVSTYTNLRPDSIITNVKRVFPKVILIVMMKYAFPFTQVKAWLADKDAEALRCQKLWWRRRKLLRKVVPSICRQAEILERKRQKKLRQKEHKARERLVDDSEIKGNISSTGEDVSAAEASLAECDFEVNNNPDIFVDDTPSPHVTYHCPDTNEGVDGDTQSGNDCDTDHNIERQTSQGRNRRRMMASRRQGLPKSQWAIANGLYASQNSQMSKPGVIQKYGTSRDQRQHKEPDEGKNHEVLIGSVSVTLGNCSQSVGSRVASQGDCSVENLAKPITAQEKPMKLESVQGGNSRFTVKLWRPVSQHGTKDPMPLQSSWTEADVVHGKDDQNLSGQSSLRFCNIDGSDNGFGNDSLIGGKVDGERLQMERSDLIKHVKLVVSSDSEPPGSQRVQDCELAACQSSNVDRCSNLANTENRLPATSGVAKSKPRMKPEKGIKIKYIPKQKAAA
ncbi:Zinc finger C2H2-type [Sesbania bispinosa]|nr:Zinc finger C2H2-type [Sesbania bispinosa]